jgi:predicted RNA-binding Zn-ribbon protein involved in translation (DUF1610 family)
MRTKLVFADYESFSHPSNSHCPLCGEDLLLRWDYPVKAWFLKQSGERVCPACVEEIKREKSCAHILEEIKEKLFPSPDPVGVLPYEGEEEFSPPLGQDF